ncbi:acetyltransferase [Arthrobacter sp. Leaf234]|uniref:GNAT family N-acetyltransferase n=1 Tax=Arthrobacter sp. Leaf234 TaxID=1736303 RepID=UPI0007016C14|nr:GNAT family N-acetyltransferase [Arthrobacter sp. Leaf234]KQO03907.1 acetyltransferase [Arthrobacter sp. Leaf234]
MTTISESIPPTAEALTLYAAVGWTAYTRDPARLERSLAGSHLVLTARDDAGTLLGLARTVSDGESICYLQDILVAPAARRSGIGRALLQDIRHRYQQCMFLALTTDAEGTPDATGSHPFYASMGFRRHADLGLAAFGLRP